MASRTQKVQAQTALQFDPQFNALAQLLADAQSNRRSSIRNARAGASAVAASANAARKPVTGIYTDAGTSQQNAASTVNQAISGLAGVDNYKAVIAGEQGAASTRIATDQANALADLVSRGVQAKAGGEYAVRQAEQNYSSDSGKIGSQLTDLSRQAGNYSSSLYDQLATQAKKDRRQADVDALNARKTVAGITGVDPATGDPTLAGKNAADAEAERQRKAKVARRKALQAKKTGGLTPTQLSDRLQRAQKGVGYATQIIKSVRQYAPHVSRAELARRLVGGLSLQHRIDGETGAAPTKNTTKVKDVDLVQIKAVDQIWASVALDLAYDGHISRANQKKLAALHVSPGRAGWNTAANPYSTGQKSRG